MNASEGLKNLLMSTFGYTAAQAYSHMGISGMNGLSDQQETTTTDTWTRIRDYAKNNGFARFTFWSVNRDRACGSSADNGICSNVSQSDWDFTKFTATFAGATPPTGTTTPATTTTTTPPSGSCAAAAWSATTAYNGGAVVTYNGHQWTAKWWTYGDTPGGPAGVWTDNGAC